MAELTKVQPGQPFKPSASTWNTMIDSAQAHQNNRHNIIDKGTTRLPNNIITVVNDSGYDLPVFAPVVTVSTATDPQTNQRQFFHDRNNPVFTVCPVDLAETAGTFMILTEPVKSGRIGKAMLYGIMSVKAYIIDENHPCISGEYGTDTLITCYDGPMKILYKESGTGIKWATVSLNIDDESIAVRNDSGEDIYGGDAVAVNNFENGCFSFVKPDKDSMLNVYSYNGPDLPADRIGQINLGRLMRFRIAAEMTVTVGMAVGTIANQWDIGKGRFGFVVVAVDGDFVWCRYNGITSVLKATSDATEVNTINVAHVDSEGVTDDQPFELDIIPEADSEGGG